MELRVMTFNLRREMAAHDIGHLWADRRPAVAELIRSARPHVLGTQEGMLPTLQDIAADLPEYAWIGEGRHGQHEEEHNAIFYLRDEYKLCEWGQFWLSEYPDGPIQKSWGASHHRICTWARLQPVHAEGSPFLVYNTHLDHHSAEARAGGIALLWHRLTEQKESTGLPVFLTGDFNAAPDELPIRFMRGEAPLDGVMCAGMTDCYSALKVEPGLTFHQFRGGDEGQPIDYIFVSEEWVPQSVIVLRNRYGTVYPSDHYPVLAILRHRIK